MSPPPAPAIAQIKPVAQSKNKAPATPPTNPPNAANTIGKNSTAANNAS